MREIDKLLSEVAELDASENGMAIDLRLDLAEIVLRNLRKRREWDQSALASAAGMAPAMVSRIVNSGANCQFSTVAKILHALGVRAKLVEVEPSSENTYTQASQAVEAVYASTDGYATYAFTLAEGSASGVDEARSKRVSTTDQSLVANHLG